MKVVHRHPWEVSPKEAVAIQNRLRHLVSCESSSGLSQVHTVAGVDVGIKDDVARAAVVVLSYPDLTPVEQDVAERPVEFPYIPGLLAFREAPVILEILESLRVEPDLLIFDGQGLAHPRRVGIASHVGVVVDWPSIGCAKSRLCGTHHEPGVKAGSRALLYDGEEVIGAVVRTRDGISPVYVSVGHKVDLQTAINYVLSCCRGYRLPETTRYAHRVAGGENLVLTATQPTLF